MENYKNPISLFKQTNFSKTIWWKFKVNISGYQNETEDKLVTEIFKNRIFRLIYPNIYQNNHKFSRILVQLYEDGYICWINLAGLIQTAFLKHQIFIPRDSFQIKSFCKHLFYYKESYTVLRPGDLLFFGNEEKCDHIGIYKGDGLYYHSSGMDFGRNGIGLDTLKNSNDKISLHYKSKLISAGRVVRNYRWDRTIR